MDQVIFQAIEEMLSSIWVHVASWMSDHGYQIVLIIFLAYLVKKFGTQIIMKLLENTVRSDLYPTKSDRSKRLKTLASLIGAILRVAVTVIAGIMIISELGLNTTPVIASAGVLGLAVGFGAQSLIKDLTTGLFIITENQYRVGDFIELNDLIKGEVQAITIRTTIIRGIDGTLFHVPNGTISWTANKTMSYAGIAEEMVFKADVDIEKLAIVIDRVGQKLIEKPEFAKKVQIPPHLDRVLGFEGSGIRIRISGRTGSDNAVEVKDAFYRLLIKELRKANIEVAGAPAPPKARPPKKPTP